MITLDNVTFTYNRHRPDALTDVSARIPEGLHLLLGENGAGKTTLLHVIAGLLNPDQGSCLADGLAVWPRNPEALSRSFFLGVDTELPFDTLADAAHRHAVFYPEFSADDLRENLAAFGLDERQKLRSLSAGNRQKALVSYALALHTPILLLDEPANGLDIDSRKELRRMIARTMREGQTIIVSTHVVNDLEALFDGLIVLSRSHLLVSAPLAAVGRALEFVSMANPLPQGEALYQEPDGPRFKAVLAAATPEADSAVDIQLLYSSLMSPARDAIISAINESAE